MTTKRTYKGKNIEDMSAPELLEALALAIDALDALKDKRNARLEAEVKRLSKQVRKL